MANWAIVIGIDQYWIPEACLQGAVNDALKMRQWLLDPTGGNVPDANLTLLLSPTATGIQPPVGVTASPATARDISTAIEDLIGRSAGQGERFFFYYSGHGLTSRMNFSNQAGIVPSDFTDNWTSAAMTLSSICERFQCTQFMQQIFIVDACRDIPWEREFVISDYSTPCKPTPPVQPQFIMYATSPGLKAIEFSNAGNERGAFTDTLLEGLKGKGAAKVWKSTQEYVVTWERLFKYVEADVKAKKLQAGFELVQVPRQGGEHGSENPELGSFRPDGFAQEVLDVSLDPDTVQGAIITVNDLGGQRARSSVISSVPARAQFTLPPNLYSVRAEAPQHRMPLDYYPIEVYASTTLPVKLVTEPIPVPAPPNGGLPPPVLPDLDLLIDVLPEAPPSGGLPPTVSPDLDLLIDTLPETLPSRGLLPTVSPYTKGTVTIETSDRVARLELADNTGQMIATGEGTLYVKEVSAGFYRARLVTPERNYVEQLIEVRPGENREIMLEPPAFTPSPLFEQVITRTGMTGREENTIEPSEAVGPTVTAHLSTVLALAGGAVNEDDTFRGNKLRNIGVHSIKAFTDPSATCGVQILFGIEMEHGDAREYLSQVGIRCWNQALAMPSLAHSPAQVQDYNGIAEYAWNNPPGQYWLSIRAPDQPAVTLSVTVLQNRLTLIVFDRNEAGEVRIFQYLPSLTGQEPRDERTSEARFPILQRSELIQRSYMSGRIEEPENSARALLEAKWVEPIAGCLGGYTLLKLNPNLIRSLLDISSSNMTNYFNSLSDSYILRGEYLAHRGDDSQAAEAFRAALDQGLPVVQDGLGRLVSGIERYQIDHPRRDYVMSVFENRVRGLMWTAVPEEKLPPPLPGDQAGSR